MNPNGLPQNLKPFKPGQSGNPKGRPKSARSKLSESFIAGLAKAFEEQGQDAINALAKDDPAKFITAVGNLVPKEFDIEHSGGVMLDVRQIQLVAPKMDDGSTD